MNRHFKGTIALALMALTACGGGGGGGGGGLILPAAVASAPADTTKPAEVEAPKPVCTVALWGDSILYGGYSGNLRHALYPALALATMRRNWTVEDHSKIGASAAYEWTSFLDEPQPTRFVVIQYGINDALLKQPYEQEMRAMIERVKSLGKTPILTGLITVPGTLENRDAYDAITKALAVEYGIPHAGWGDEVQAGGDETMDRLHPNQAYSLRLSTRLATTLDTAAPDCAQ